MKKTQKAIAAAITALIIITSACIEDYEELPSRMSSAGSGPWSACYSSHDPYNPKRQQGFVEWTPDGSAIIFNQDTYAYQTEQSIWSIREDGSNLRKVAKTTPPGTDNTASSYGFNGNLSQDGKYLVHSTCFFESQWDDDTTIRAHQLAISKMDGSRPVQITKSHAFQNYPAWSPDGTRIAYVGNFSEGGSYPSLPNNILRLWILKIGPNMNLEAISEGKLPFRTPLTGERKYTVNASPEWSPESEYNEQAGRHLAFLSPTESSVSQHAPVWSPNSQYLAYMAREGNQWAAHVMELDHLQATSTVKIPLRYQAEELHWNRFNIARPTWAPDSSKLAFVSNEPDGESTIHITTPEGITIKELEGPTSPTSHIAWHPHGPEILIAADGLWKLNTDDWTLQPIARSHWIQTASNSGRSMMTGIAWSPDGSRLAARLGPFRETSTGFWLITMDQDGKNPRLVATYHYQSPYYFKPCGLDITLEDAFENIGLRPVCE